MKSGKKLILVLQLFGLAVTAGNCFAQSNMASQIIRDRLSHYFESYPVEKAYLQFDKPYYSAGDTIYFKAYVTAGELHKLSTVSGVLHVDLINTKNKPDQSIKLQLDSGIAWGDFALPDSLPAGNYRIRAYTCWMRNDGDSSFFEKTIPVSSAKPAKVSESPAGSISPGSKPDIQFLPEGGTFIAGIDNQVAFKAIGPNGLGIDVKGIVIDNDGKQVAGFASQHLGMGSFSFIPVTGQTYTARVDYGSNQQATVALPAAQAGGILLSVNNDVLPNAAVAIRASNVYFKQNKGKDHTLLISSGGLITTVDCKLDSAMIHIDILKRRLRTGIATVTLFSPDNLPMAERLFFVQNYDALSLNVASDKLSYAAREQTHISLNALNRHGNGAAGHFSISVVNENIVPDADRNGENILSYLLLTSDLKGFVQQPAYYFADTSVETRENLDLLMLTQGYRRFEWEKVLDTAKQQLAYQPESGITIAGHVYNSLNKPVNNGAVTLIPPKSGGLHITTTDKNGWFSFSNLNLTDTAHFVLSATNEKGKNLTKIILRKDSLPVAGSFPASPLQQDSLGLAGYTQNEKQELDQVATYINRKTVLLKQVNIHDKKPDNQYRTESLAGPGNADQVMHADEIGQIDGSLVTSLNGRLRGILFIKTHGNGPPAPYLTTSVFDNMPGNPPKPMLVIIDGAQVSPETIGFLNSEEVETIEVLKYASASMYGVEGGGGVLVVTTKRTRQDDPEKIPAIGVLPVTMVGFYKARQFYSPKYDTPAAIAGKQHDLRSTVYWQPEIKTDKDGIAEFEYYNADTPGTYKITIEGIDKDGNIGRQVYRYEVK